MEVEDLVSALEAAIVLLRRSESSLWTKMSAEEIIAKLQSEQEKAENSVQTDASLLKYLFAPTGPIQEISIDNGWGEALLEISNVIDRFLSNK